MASKERFLNNREIKCETKKIETYEDEFKMKSWVVSRSLLRMH